MMRNCSEKGFTLVEVLVSMTIFSFGILAVINMQLLSASINIKARGMTEGVIAAQNKIEELSTLDYGHDDLKAGVAHADSDGRYTLSWTVVDDEPMVNSKTIRVVVSWDLKGVTSNFELQMMKTKS
ncbi:MAG: prepilin-type N-terminal cleavage/methylation domain-containing protein [Desulfuromonadales bacterium]|nr:prepilin-type N-terminal cleavage/methylation domain-containing protein [Desulfuromonadales bacterium]